MDSERSWKRYRFVYVSAIKCGFRIHVPGWKFKPNTSLPREGIYITLVKIIIRTIIQLQTTVMIRSLYCLLLAGLAKAHSNVQYVTFDGVE